MKTGSPRNAGASDFSGGAFRMRMTVALLGACQALMMSATMLIGTSSALTGKMLSPYGGVATLPLALQYVSAMGFAAPVALWMQRLGRRTGFLIGAGALGISGLISVAAIVTASFPLFCFASLFYGVAHASILHYRFAAAEAASAEFRPKAISLVMSGGVLAAVIGPNLARFGENYFSPYTFAGGFCLVTVLAVVCGLLLTPMRLSLHDGSSESDQRPLLMILRQPRFAPALASAMLGYGMMVFVMTATPLAMQSCGFSFGETAFVLQFHALAMFSPSFVTGHLIARFGERAIIASGTIYFVFAMAIGLSGQNSVQFLAALVFLGIGWNFLFIGGTTLLTKCYRPSERGKVQALNETLTLGCVAVSSLVAGGVEFYWGWQAILGVVVLPILLVFLVLLRMGPSDRPVSLTAK